MTTLRSRRVRSGARQRPERILVLGLGVTGLSVLKRFSGKADIIGFDEGFGRFSPDLRRKIMARTRTVVTDRRLLAPRIREADQIVVSPGIVLPHLGLSCDDTRVVGDLDLAYDARRGGTFIAVTGTNGKTTTTKLLAAILTAQFGRSRVVVAGNIGTPLLDEVGKRKDSLYVVELSSFQLELAKQFRPTVGIFLNLSQNHLDRHKTMAAYFDAKSRLFKFCRAGDVAVINLDDPYGAQLATHLHRKKNGARVVGYTMNGKTSANTLHLRGNTVMMFTNRGDHPVFDLPQHLFGPGAHNRSNLLAATAAALSVGVRPAAIVRAVRRFRLPAHRLEFVRDVGGVGYYDDSKATSVDAVRKAIESFPSRQVVALMGGQDKGMDFTPLFRELTRRRNLKSLVFFGDLGSTFNRLAAKFRLPHRKVDRVNEAIQTARQMASPGDIILLTPGGTSFDQYRNYAERGDDFRRCVERLR